MVEHLVFSFAGRAIDYFGSKAISSDITALFELIKNSRDANAKKVTITFQDVKKDNALIKIYDDGDGMTEIDVKEKWMVIGTDSRIHDNKTKSGKAVWGEMGIGRMACQKLGGETEMTSVKKNQKIKMTFDWSVFEKPGITVDKIQFPIEKSDGTDIENGVTLELKKLKSHWDIKKINLLKEEISVLISQDNIDDLQIEIKVGNEDGEIIGKNYAKLRQKVIDNAPFKIKAKFDGTKLTVHISTQFGRKPSWEKQDVMGDYQNAEVGQFTVDIYHFPRASGKLKTSPIEKFYDLKIGVDKLEGFLKNNHGPYIYRDGTWMKPYGGDMDWLGMEASARQETSKIGIKQIYGEIHLSKKNNPEIRPASHRETLIENQAFRDLKSIMGEIFEILRNYVKNWKDEEDVKTIHDMGVDIDNSKNTIGEICKNITKISADLPSAQKRHLKTSIDGIIAMTQVTDQQHESEISELNATTDWEKNLATLGIATSYMAREVTEPLESIKETIDEAEDMMNDLEKKQWKISTAEIQRSWEMILEMKNNQSKMQHFMIFVDVLSSHISQSIKNSKKATQVDVLKCWETVSNGFESKKKELDIEIIDDWSKNKNADSNLVVKLDRIDLECILTNLYLNSIESLSKTKGRKRKVTFIYWYRDDALNIEFIDNGRGIPKNKLEEIFEPFKFGHNENNDEKHGHGLGLHLVKTIMERYDGTAVAIEVNEGAKIWIRFPDIKKVG